MTNGHPLRELAFATKSKDIFGNDDTHPEAIWGVIMETAYEDFSLTLVSLVDGACSLYISNGGGVIGAGEHAHVAALSSSIASGSGIFFSAYAAPVTEFPYPSPDHVHFYFLSDSQILKTVELSEEELGEDAYPLSPLFHAIHLLIGSMREIEENSETPEIEPEV